MRPIYLFIEHVDSRRKIEKKDFEMHMKHVRNTRSIAKRNISRFIQR